MESPNPYTSQENARFFDQYVERDSAKELIYDDVIEIIAQSQRSEASPLVVADIGSGSGHFVQRLTTIVPEAHILYADVSLAQLAVAKSKLQAQSSKTLGVCTNLENGVPFADQSVDYVVSHFVLQEVEDFQGVVEEFHRILKPNGTAVISMTSPLSDLVTQTLKPQKIHGLDPEIQMYTQKAHYLLGKHLTVPHIYRYYEGMIRTIIDVGFHLTTDDMVRFYPARPFPLPEYLVIYLRKDSNPNKLSTLFRKISYERSKNAHFCDSRVRSTKGDEFIRITNK